MPLPESPLAQVSQYEGESLLAGTAASGTSDRKALMDGALDAMAAISVALADNARDDEGTAAATACLDAVMCMGPEQDIRRESLNKLDRWFFNGLDDDKHPPLCMDMMGEDGAHGGDDDEEVYGRNDPPIFPLEPDDVRFIRNGLWLVDFNVFHIGRSSVGHLPTRNANGETCRGNIDGEMKVEQ